MPWPSVRNLKSSERVFANERSGRSVFFFEFGAALFRQRRRLHRHGRRRRRKLIGRQSEKLLCDWSGESVTESPLGDGTEFVFSNPNAPDVVFVETEVPGIGVAGRSSALFIKAFSVGLHPDGIEKRSVVRFR